MKKRISWRERKNSIKYFTSRYSNLSTVVFLRVAWHLYNPMNGLQRVCHRRRLREYPLSHRIQCQVLWLTASSSKDFKSTKGFSHHYIMSNFSKCWFEFSNRCGIHTFGIDTVLKYMRIKNILPLSTKDKQIHC